MFFAHFVVSASSGPKIGVFGPFFEVFSLQTPILGLKSTIFASCGDYPQWGLRSDGLWGIVGRGCTPGGIEPAVKGWPTKSEQNGRLGEPSLPFGAIFFAFFAHFAVSAAPGPKIGVLE